PQSFPPGVSRDHGRDAAPLSSESADRARPTAAQPTGYEHCGSCILLRILESGSPHACIPEGVWAHAGPIPTRALANIRPPANLSTRRTPNGAPDALGCDFTDAARV